MTVHGIFDAYREKEVKVWTLEELKDTVDTVSYTHLKIIVLMRLPRIAMAIIAGIGLAVSGTAMQAVTRNPLVSPVSYTHL